MSIYNNNTFEVSVGKSREKEYEVYLCTNLDTKLIEFESSMLLEALEAADFFKEKLDAREQEKAVVNSVNVASINETLATH